MRISDWSSDVCSSDLLKEARRSSSFRDRNVAGTSFRRWKGWRRPQGRGFRRGFEGKGAASRSPKRGTPGRGGAGRSISPRRGERKAGGCVLPTWPVLLRPRSEDRWVGKEGVRQGSMQG